MVHFSKRPKERSHSKRFPSFNQSNFDNSTQCHMNDDCCLVFVDGSLLSYLFLASPGNLISFEVAISLKHLLKGGWVPFINKNFDSAPTKQVPTRLHCLSILTESLTIFCLSKSLSNKLRNWKKRKQVPA